MKNKKTTINDIARALSISPSAVSKALNQHPRISKTTREAVEAMARQMRYEPNHIAAALRKGKSQLIGIIVPAIDINFFAVVVKGIEFVVNQAGYNVIISQSHDSFEKEQQNIDALLKTQVDGIICSLANSTTQHRHLEKVLQQGVPLVLFDRTEDQLPLSTVVIDDYQGATVATQHLISQGCRKILHLAGPQKVMPYQLRAQGFKDALKTSMVPIHKTWIIESTLSIQDGRHAMADCLATGICPDGVFASSDQAALGALQILKAHGLAIPNDVAIIGFSNEPFTSYVQPALSTVEQYGEKMGQLAANLILEQCNQEIGRFVHRKIVLPTALVIRDSSDRKRKL
ncbi:MAG: LacI family DNA-binding transcriptional regulator [Saprospiraceae bacterium]